LGGADQAKNNEGNYVFHSANIPGVGTAKGPTQKSGGEKPR
jgi:hypothetical protein